MARINVIKRQKRPSTNFLKLKIQRCTCNRLSILYCLMVPIIMNFNYILSSKIISTIFSYNLKYLSSHGCNPDHGCERRCAMHNAAIPSLDFVVRCTWEGTSMWCKKHTWCNVNKSAFLTLFLFKFCFIIHCFKIQNCIKIYDYYPIFFDRQNLYIKVDKQVQNLGFWSCLALSFHTRHLISREGDAMSVYRCASWMLKCISEKLGVITY